MEKVILLNAHCWHETKEKETRGYHMAVSLKESLRYTDQLIAADSDLGDNMSTGKKKIHFPKGNYEFR